MSLTENMKTDFEEVERLAEKAETHIKNGQTEKAEKAVENIKHISNSWL